MIKISGKEIEKIGKLFKTTLGQEVMGILNREIYNTISYIPGDSDASDFNEGHRDVIHFFHNAVKAVEEKQDVPN